MTHRVYALLIQKYWDSKAAWLDSQDLFFTSCINYHLDGLQSQVPPTELRYPVQRLVGID
jgi:hypothetical protein